MCYCITLYNIQCQDNVNIVYNNILLYKTVINKSIIKITYVTTSMPILSDIVWFNNTVVIQCTVYSIHGQWVQYSFVQYNQECGQSLCHWQVQNLGKHAVKLHTCVQFRILHSVACLLSLNTLTCVKCSHITLHIFKNTCSIGKYVVNTCNNTLLP